MSESNTKIRTYKMCLRVKNTTHVFGEGFEPGVLMHQIIDIKETGLSPTRIAMGILGLEENFLAENIYITTEEVTEEPPTEKEDGSETSAGCD